MQITIITDVYDERCAHYTFDCCSGDTRFVVIMRRIFMHLIFVRSSADRNILNGSFVYSDCIRIRWVFAIAMSGMGAKSDKTTTRQ